MSAVIEILNALTEVFIVLFFFRQTLRPKKIRGAQNAAVIAAVSAVHIARSFFPIPTYANFALTFVLWSVLALCLFDDSVIKKAVMLLLYFIMVILCDMLSRFITAAILDIDYTALSAVGLQRYIFMLINMFLCFIFLSVTALCIKRRSTDIDLKYWIMLLLFPVFSLFIVISTDFLLILAGVNDIKYICLLLVIVMGLLYFNTVIFEFIDSYSAKLKLNAARELLKKQEENYHLLEINEKDLRFIRHNINKHMTIMRDMLENNHISESRELLENLTQITALPLGMIYTDDVTLDSILNVEGKKAASHGIKYIVKTQRLTAPLRIGAADKSSILCNALDNAVEGCLNAKTAEKFIIIDIASDAERINISIENSSRPVKIRNGNIFSTKKDARNHGLGIDSIRSTLRKYNGALSITHENGVTLYAISLENKSI